MSLKLIKLLEWTENYIDINTKKNGKEKNMKYRFHSALSDQPTNNPIL